MLVTGANGRVGNAVVRELLAQGWRVRALVRSAQRPVSLQGVEPLELVRADIGQPESLRGALTGVTHVIHSAAFVSLNPAEQDRMAHVNVEGTRHLLVAARQAGVPNMVLISSREAFQSPAARAVVNEDTPLAVSSGRGYARTKALATRLALSFNSPEFRVWALAPTGVIGPLDFEPSLQGQEFVRQLRGRTVMVPEARTDWVDTQDFAATTVRSLTLARGGEAYLVGGHDFSMVDGARIMREHVSGRAGQVVPFRLEGVIAGLALLGRLGRWDIGMLDSLRILQESPQFDCRKAQRDLGHAPRPVEESLRDSADWLQARGWERAVPREAVHATG